MSAGSDDVFARWSRRKQAVRETERDEEQEAAHVRDAAAAETGAESAGHGPVAVQPDPAQADSECPEPLPSLDDLTSESDLSAFMRENVPKALKSAAMRRMWSLDPAIRDFVGPSEYAWDFNKPGSMAGFGPLDATESPVNFLSTVENRLPDADDRAEAPAPAPEPTAAALPEQQADAAEDDPTASVPPKESVDSPGGEGRSGASTDGNGIAADRAEASPSGEAPQTSMRLRHGGATPR